MARPKLSNLPFRIRSNYSQRTVDAYVESAQALVEHYKEAPPGRISNPMIQDFLLHRMENDCVSWNTCHRDMYGISYLYRNLLKRDVSNFFIPGRKTLKRLPKPLSWEQIKRLIKVTSNIKHQTILMTIYGSGVRAEEAAHLKICDIERDRGLLRVDQGKGNKDRYTVLPESLVNQLIRYCRACKPLIQLFPGRDPNNAISVASIQQIFYKAQRKAGIKCGCGVHCLRHSFATHMIENGWDLATVQKLMGHKWASTTAKYIHVSQNRIKQIKSPLDLLGLDAGDRESCLSPVNRRQRTILQKRHLRNWPMSFASMVNSIEKFILCRLNT